MTLLSDAMFAAEMKGMLMAQGIDLGYAATLPSKEAVAYFRAKGRISAGTGSKQTQMFMPDRSRRQKRHAWTY